MFGKIKSNVSDLRDSDGNFTFILDGVDFLTLKGLSELLYTGATTLPNEDHKKALFDLLSSEVKKSVELSADHRSKTSLNEPHEFTRRIFVSSSSAPNLFKTEEVCDDFDPLSTGQNPTKKRITRVTRITRRTQQQ